ncbi:MAG: TRAP transporter substrate-binding protein [Pseudomonadota bacterium]|nr:TRAP transporter substrate-binding protein [Pseudomonadota bacterium]
MTDAVPAGGLRRLLPLALLGLTLSGPGVAEEEVTALQLETPMVSGSQWPGWGTTIKWVSERLGLASNGSLTMQTFEPRERVAPFEILDAVSTGKVNSGFSSAGYWAGKLPAAPLFSAVPFGPEAGEFLAWLWYDDGMQLYQEMYDTAGYNVKVLLCGMLAPESSGWFVKEIRRPEDLAGLNMRFLGLGGKVMQKLGVNTLELRGGSVTESLKEKKIAATEFSMPVIDEKLGFHKLARYNYFPGWHQQATTMELLVNKDTWKSMHPSQQALLDIICRAATADSFAYTESIQAEALRKEQEEHGVELRYWSDDMLLRFKEAWQEVAEEQAQQDPFFRKVWQAQDSFRGSYDRWQRYGFLPRPRPPESARPPAPEREPGPAIESAAAATPRQPQPSQ